MQPGSIKSTYNFTFLFQSIRLIGSKLADLMLLYIENKMSNITWVSNQLLDNLQLKMPNIRDCKGLED